MTPPLTDFGNDIMQTNLVSRRQNPCHFIKTSKWQHTLMEYNSLLLMYTHVVQEPTKYNLAFTSEYMQSRGNTNLF